MVLIRQIRLLTGFVATVSQNGEQPQLFTEIVAMVIYDMIGGRRARLAVVLWTFLSTSFLY